MYLYCYKSRLMQAKACQCKQSMPDSILILFEVNIFHKVGGALIIFRNESIEIKTF